MSKNAIWILIVFAAATVLCLPIRASADDGYVTGIGGAVKLMKGHPCIRMVGEEVHVRMDTADVDARFVFKNDGPAVKVLIGFPEEGKDVEPQTRTHMTGFRAFVDGKKVDVVRRVATRPTDDNDYDYKYYWVKEVAFGPGETHVLVDKYRGGKAVTGYGWSGFNYVLKTGASWHGPIGHARIITPSIIIGPETA
jgi:hypothetical protein